MISVLFGFRMIVMIIIQILINIKYIQIIVSHLMNHQEHVLYVKKIMNLTLNNYEHIV
jgi:hypothetical protein